MWTYNYADELYHYGVKGMKWGHRKKYYNSDGSLNKAGKARQAYKDAKKNFKVSKRKLSKSSFTAFGVKGIENYERQKAATQKAYAKTVSTKAKLKASTAKNEQQAAKREFATYKNAMFKTGIPGSGGDVQRGGASTAIYNDLKTRKGKEYADKVVKRVQNETIAMLATSATVVLGQAALAAYSANH